MLDQPVLFKSDARFNSSRPATELEGAFLAKTRLPLGKRVGLAAALRDGRVTMTKPTVAQCAALCRVPPASIRTRKPRKPLADALGEVWARATAEQRERFVRGHLIELWDRIDAVTR
jgi:hypothetical protein